MVGFRSFLSRFGALQRGLCRSHPRLGFCLGTNVARAELLAAELSVIAKVKRAYYELYYVQQALALIDAELKTDILDGACYNETRVDLRAL